MIRKKIQNLIKNVIRELQEERVFPKFDIPEVEIEHPEEKRHGDYATNIAMRIAKLAKKSAMETAELIAKGLESRIKNQEFFEKIKIAKPGFINFFLSKTVLLNELKKILKQKESYGSSSIGDGRTIIIDYSAPNIAKPFGIGHLRSTIIGQAIYNLYKYLGFKVIGDNHIGDWGTQFGKLICAVKNWGDKKKIEKAPIEELNNLYVKFHKELKMKPELEEEGRRWFKKLEKGDKEARRIWKKCVNWSLKEFDRIYKILGIKIDLIIGESFYHSMSKDVIKRALDKKVAIKSRGAVIISFPNDALPPFMIQKSDGATLYSTRDLATINYRLKKFKPDKIIYEVGADQVLHFKQLFWAAELLGWGKKEKYFHIAHGMMRLPTGKMRTRTGEVIFLEEVLNEAIKKSRKILKEKNPNLKGKDKVAKAVGIGAVKYNDLSHHYSGDIVFDWKKILNLKGNSGPYLQYAYARACSILRKSRIKEQEIKKFKGLELKHKKEIELLKLLSRFPEVIEKSAKNYSPNLICNFLFELTQRFNAFYETIPVLKAKTKELKKARLALVIGISQVLKNGLSLLGIEPLKKM